MSTLKKYLATFIVTVAVLSTYIFATEAKAPADHRPSDSTEPVYVVKEYDGYIAVFNYHNNIPHEILDVHVSSLPEYDRQLLKTGIEVYSEVELSSLIEDLDS